MPDTPTVLAQVVPTTIDLVRRPELWAWAIPFKDDRYGWLWFISSGKDRPHERDHPSAVLVRIPGESEPAVDVAAIVAERDALREACKAVWAFVHGEGVSSDAAMFTVKAALALGTPSPTMPTYSGGIPEEAPGA